MINPKQKSKVVHSQSKAAWNVVSTTLGLKFKIARVPYFHESEKDEALRYAKFISKCINRSEEIIKIM